MFYKAWFLRFPISLKILLFMHPLANLFFLRDCFSNSTILLMIQYFEMYLNGNTAVKKTCHAQSVLIYLMSVVVQFL